MNTKRIGYLLKRIVPFGILFALLLLANHIRQFQIHAQTCYSIAQVQSDARCLYILNNKVYEKGSRSSPHKGNPCGIDVTAIIPAFHFGDVVKYLDPNYVGNICVAASPTATPTVTPTLSPTPSIPVTVTSTPTVTTIPLCALKSKGDANCDGYVSIVDYELWRREFIGLANTFTADFSTNGTRRPDLIDFEIWRSTFIPTVVI